MDLRTELKRRLRKSSDWMAALDEFEREAEGLSSEQEKSDFLFELGRAAEEIVPDRDRALGAYQRSWKVFRENLKALARAREVYRETGRLEMVVKLGELELKSLGNGGDPLYRSTVTYALGLALLDLGQKDQAASYLAQAVALLPNDHEVSDALKAAQYDQNTWLDEVERLAVEADSVGSEQAARMCLQAARVLMFEAPEDPSYERMLRRVLSYEPQNESANFLLESLLANAERWDELATHQENRAYAAPDDGDQARLYRRFALEWLQRFKDRKRAAEFFVKALSASCDAGGKGMSGQVAGLRLLEEVLGGLNRWDTLLALIDRLLDSEADEDVRLFAAAQASRIAWREVGDTELARGYVERLARIEPDHEMVREFKSEVGSAGDAPAEQAVKAEKSQSKSEPQPPPVETRIESAPVAAARVEEPAPSVSRAEPSPPPVAVEASSVKRPPMMQTSVAAAPPDEEISAKQARLIAEAGELEQQSPERAIEAWKKAVAMDRAKRLPRRELARLLRDTGKWNALIEALKDEETRACPTPEEKVDVLKEMASTYRDHLNLPVMVANTLNQILTINPSDSDVLGELAAQYEEMNRWSELVKILQKQATLTDIPGEQAALQMRIAKLYLEKHNNKAEAIKAYEAVLAIEPDNAVALAELKSAYEQRRDWEKLLLITRREIEGVSDPAERLARTVERARMAAEKLRRPSVSIEAWQDVLAENPDHLEALAELEKLYEREKDWTKLAETCSRLAEIATDPAARGQALQKLGLLYTEKTPDTDKAIDAWRALAEIEPDNRRAQDALRKLYLSRKAWTQLEEFYRAQGKVDEYVRVIERQLEQEETSEQVTLGLRVGDLYRDELDKSDRALRAYEKVLTLDDTNLQAAQSMIPLYEQAKDYKKLARVLEVQLGRTSDVSDRLTRTQHLAELNEERLRDRGAAFGWWLKAFQLDPESHRNRAEVERLAGETSAWESLVDAYRRATDGKSDTGALPLLQVIARVQENEIGDLDRALETNRKILSIDEQQGDALMALERIQIARGSHEELLVVLERRLELAKEQDARREIRGRIATLLEEHVGDDRRAVTVLEESLSETGDERPALQALDRIYQKRGDWTELADVLSRQLVMTSPGDEQPRYVGLKFRLADVQTKHLGRVADAIENYREILDLMPGHELARAALEKQLDDKTHKLVTAGILEPIYEKLEQWENLIRVHEIQLQAEDAASEKVRLLMRIGQLYSTQLGDAEQSFGAYSRATQIDPGDLAARGELERIAALLDDGWQQVVKLYDDALSQDDLDPVHQHELALKAAQLYDERLEDTGRAIDSYKKALTVEPDDRDALEALDRIYTREERYADLLEIYRRKVELTQDPGDRMSLLFKIASLWEEVLANPTEAVTAYKEVLGLDADNVAALRALDRLFQTQENWQDLADNLNRQLALAEEPGLQVALLLRLAELREQRLDEAAASVEVYRQVLELAPRQERAVDALERLMVNAELELVTAQILEPIYRETGHWQRQIQAYEIMVRHAYDPARKIELLQQIGELYELAGDEVEKAFDAYARAFREEPSGQSAQQALERIARTSGQWEPLVELYRRVADDVSDPELKVRILMRLAQVLEGELARDADAVATYEKVFAVDEANIAAISAIASVHERNADYDRWVSALKRKAEIVLDVDQRKQLYHRAAQVQEEVLEDAESAIKTYGQVLEIDEVDAPAMDALERLFIRLERWEQLKNIYARKADLAQDPAQKKQRLYVLGQVHDRELGDVNRAIETYQAILDLDPDEVPAIQALDRLYAQAERWYDLLGVLDRQVELADGSAEVVGLRHRIGQLWETSLGDLSRAIESYREALTLDPQHEPTIESLESLAHREGEPVLAAKALEPIYEASSEHEKLVEVYEVLAQHTEEVPAKIEFLHKIAELEERRLERHERAFDAHARAFREDSTLESTLTNLERLADAIRDWPQVTRLYEAELGKNHEGQRRTELLLRLARVYDQELTQPEQAANAYQRVLEGDAENWAALDALDRLYDQGEHWRELAEVLRKKTRLATGDEVTGLGFRLAQVTEQQLRDVPAAIELYRDLLLGDPLHLPTQTALELLFSEGQNQREIAEILEPLYRDAQQWEKLHSILTVHLEKVAEPADRQSMYLRLAELAEEKLVDPIRAFGWWTGALREDPTQERAHAEAERLARDTGSWSELVQTLHQVLEGGYEADTRRSLLLRVGRIYERELKDLGQAEAAYSGALEIDAQDAEALEALDRIYEASGMFNELADILQRRVDQTMDSTQQIALLSRLGRIQIEVLDDLPAAEAAYLKILDQESRHRRSLEQLEFVYYKQEAWQKLFETYEKMTDVAQGDEELAEIYARMARLSSEALEDEQGAIERWQRVNDLVGENPRSLGAMAAIHERRGEWQELKDVLERQVALASSDEARLVLYKRLGRIWAEHLSRERNALDAWLQAFRIDSQDLETLNALATLYRATQSWEELSDTLRQILEVGQVMGEMTEADMVSLYAQLGELEGEYLGRTDEAVNAWRRVLALDPGNAQALSALEALFTREGRWEDGIDVLERRAQVLTSEEDIISTLLEAGSIWEERVADKERAAATFERVRARAPGNATASSRLESIYRENYQWAELSEVLLERVEHTAEAMERMATLQQVAKIYEEELSDQESAFVVLQAAFREDYSYDPVAKELERLATAAHKWNELLNEYSQVVASLEGEDPEKATDLWVKIGRWYGEHLSHVDYAIHSIQAALRLNPHHSGALTALAGLLRQRQSWSELVDTLRTHAAVEPTDERRTELFMSLGELLELQMQDPIGATEEYRSALEVNPASMEALQALERLYRQNQMFGQLVDILGRKAAVAPEPQQQVELLLEVGRLWDESLSDTAKAVKAFKGVLDVDGSNLRALRALELIYERTGESEAYLDILEQQLDASPSDAERISLYQRMASAWEERFGKLDRAAESLEKIIALDDRNFAAYRELERIYQQDGKWESLVDTYRRHALSTQDRQTQIDLHCAMGQVYEEELNDADGAVQEYGAILNIDADEPRALNALGRLYERIEEWDRAIAAMRTLANATEDRPLQVDLLHRIGRIQGERLDDTASAEAHFLQALSIDPNHVGTMQSLIALYEGREDWQKSAHMMARAEQHTQHPLEKVRLLHGAAELYRARLMDPDRAVVFYQGAMAIDPEHVTSGEPLAALLFERQRWQELEPVVDMLVRKAPQQQKDSRELNELYFRAATVAGEMGKDDKALKLFKAAYDLDATHLPTVLGRANLLFKMKDWDGAGKLYQTLLVQHRDSQNEHEVVDVYYRLGQVRLALGERKKALNMFEKALQTDPAHRDTLVAVIALQSQGGDWEAVIHAKRSLLPIADAEEKFNLLSEVGDLYYEKLQNPQKSVAAYLESLEIKANHHSTLQKILDRYTETKNWKKAVEVMLRFAELEEKPLRRGKYYYAAGVITRDEVKSLDDAIDYFNQALDSYFVNPDAALADESSGYLKAFEAIDKLCTMKRDWKLLERNYRKMIKRMPQQAGNRLLIMLWHNLGEIYRSRLQNLQAAAQAFEVASHLEPDNLQRHQILAELYLMSGPDSAEKAIQEHMFMLQREPLRTESYKALRQIYMEMQQYDKAWCLCNALVFLQKADPDEQQLWEQYRPRQFVRATNAVSNEMWKRIFHPDQDRYVSAIFGAIWEPVALMYAGPHKKFEQFGKRGLKRSDRTVIETDQLQFSKVFHYASQVLNLPLPDVFIRQEVQGEIIPLNAEEKGMLIPSFVVGQQLLSGRSQQELAYVAAKWLCYTRPEHYLRKSMPSNTELKTAFTSALTLVQPNFPVKPELAAMVAQFRPLLQQRLTPLQMEQLAKVVQRFLERGEAVDLNKWAEGVDNTCFRVGFIVSNDLQAAAKLVAREPSVVGGPQSKDRMKELVVYSVSEDYFLIRQQLGLAIG